MPSRARKKTADPLTPEERATWRKAVANQAALTARRLAGHMTDGVLESFTLAVSVEKGQSLKLRATNGHDLRECTTMSKGGMVVTNPASFADVLEAADAVIDAARHLNERRIQHGRDAEAENNLHDALVAYDTFRGVL